MEILDFETIAVPAPDLETLAGRVEGLRSSLRGARDAEAALAALREWDALRREIDTWSSLVDLRFSQDTRDPESKAARERWDEMAPGVTELHVRVKRELLDHPLRADLEARLGAQAFALWEADVLSFDPAIEDDLVRESKLEAEYTELLASAAIEFQGETHNLSTMRRFRQAADRGARHAAAKAQWEWFAGHGETLDRIYDRLVDVRTRMAHQLGFADFVELGYERMSRIGYGRDDVERFRKSVLRHVVPLCAELRRRQAERLGLEKLMDWDENVQDPAGNPTPLGDHDWMVARAQEMFDGMGGRLGEFYRRMSEGRFLDLKSRPGKAGGGFCTSFPTHGMPFVFANFNGTKDDVEVFTHEMGHAFQNWSASSQELSDYFWPTYESAEVHSMSLEFLTWPWMEGFFGEGAERFRRMHLAESLLFLPYGAAVDHFQHEVYARPELTPAERHALWRRMEETYLPGKDWGDLEYAARGGRWQLQAHVYGAPFYYVDYVLAQTCAMQFWVRAERDRDEALAAYVALCERGGQAPFQELVRSAGLTSPFDEGCLEEVVEKARAVLGV